MRVSYKQFTISPVYYNFLIRGLWQFYKPSVNKTKCEHYQRFIDSA